MVRFLVSQKEKEKKKKTGGNLLLQLLSLEDGFTSSCGFKSGGSQLPT